MLFRGLLIFAIVGWFVLIYSCAQTARADTLAEAQAAGWLPTWLDPADDYRVLERKEGTTYWVYHCLEDATTKARWTLRTKRLVEREVREGRSPFNLAAPKAPATTAQQAVCFPVPLPPPVPPGPKALGEPAYLNLVCPDGCQENKPLDWATMNRPANIAGKTVKGEACGHPTGLGFYELRRLQKTPLVPVTRCAP